MTIVRRLARPLLAASFVERGLDAVRHPGPHVEATAALLARVGPPLHLPNDPVLVVRASGGLMAASGLMLATGRAPRLSALVAALTLVPTTTASHAFWQEKDPVARREQRVHFLKNVSLMGAALLAAVDTEGQPGLAWRTRDASKRASRGAKRAAKRAERSAERAGKSARSALPV
jgi:putative oxidoreductase